MSDSGTVRPAVYIDRSRTLTREAVAAAIADLGQEASIRSAKTIIIKVNLAAGVKATPDLGTNVDPEQVAALLEVLTSLQEDGRVLIAESDSTGGQLASAKFAHLGYDNRYLSRWGNRVEVADLSRLPAAFYDPPLARRFHKVLLPRAVMECDYLISCGCIKTHNFARLTGAVKNMFGCLPEMDKHRHHPWLTATLIDIISLRRPDLSVLLGNPGQVGNGPVHGVPTHFGLNLLGNDPIATDACEALVLGVHPSRVSHLRGMAKAGLGTIAIDAIRLSGDSLEGLPSERQFVGPWARSVMWSALRVQGLGQTISALGHQMHRVHRPSQLLRIYRPAARWLRRRTRAQADTR